MPICTKLHVLLEQAEKDDLMYPMLRKVSEGVNSLIPDERLRGIEMIRKIRDNQTEPGDGVYTKAEIRLTEDLNCASVSFFHNGESRSIFVAFYCDSDHLQMYGKPGVSLLINDWGASRKIMQAVGEQLTAFGEVWLTPCDAYEDKSQIGCTPARSPKP